MCTSRRNSITGVSKPLMKPGTTNDPDVVRCFRILSNVARQTHIPWLEQQGLEAFCDPDHPKRQDVLARVIHPDNLLEGMRFNETDVEHPCGAHSDQLNSPKLSMSLVVGLSVILGNKRIAMNGCSRQSGDSFLKESNRLQPLIDHLLDSYASVPCAQQTVSSQSHVDGREVIRIPGYPVVQNHCNMDPVSFHNPLLFHILVLVQRFRLTHPRMHWTADGL